ncbi:MAG: septal ring lytic transglycosylase RlpA family protein [Zoogloeaceae bacterium]|nr:septal ring lytic transglycosylase RlpA family protein [Zoogloeaceae bacterium]
MPDAPATAHPPVEIGQSPTSPKEAAPVEVVKNAPKTLGAIIRGKASFYGKPDSGKFHGRRTANGERFDRRAFTAASNRFPLGSWVAVRRTDKAACVLVWVNDRMHARHKVRIIDLSYAAAEALGSVRIGVAKVEARQLRGSKNEKPAGCEQAFELETAKP